MRRAGIVVGGGPRAAQGGAVRPGVSTAELDAVAEEHIRGAARCRRSRATTASRRPSARRSTTRSSTGSPGSGCSSTATSSRSTAEPSSTAGTATRRSPSPSGTVTAEVAELIEITEQALWSGLAAVRLGGRLSDIGHAVESSVRSPRGLRHRRGVRRPRHRHRDAPAAQRGELRPPRSRPGAGRGAGARGRADGQPRHALHPRARADGWTVVTQDGRWSAHFEHTVAVTAAGPWVLTALDGGAERLSVARACDLPVSPRGCRWRRLGRRLTPARLSRAPRLIHPGSWSWLRPARRHHRPAL